MVGLQGLVHPVRNRLDASGESAAGRRVAAQQQHTLIGLLVDHVGDLPTAVRV